MSHSVSSAPPTPMRMLVVQVSLLSPVHIIRFKHPMAAPSMANRMRFTIELLTGAWLQRPARGEVLQDIIRHLVADLRVLAYRGAFPMRHIA